MRRLSLLLSIGLASFAAACSSGNGVAPPPPMGNFTNASLKGNYAFSMVGEDINGQFIARVGSFVADGSGGISAAFEDVTDAGTNTTVAFGQPSTYNIQANGKGTITLATLAGSALQLSISLNAVAPAGQGLMIQTDLNATSSGSFSQQNTAIFTTPFAASNYVFDFSGVDSAGAATSYVGEIAINAGGVVGSGTVDRYDGNTPTDPSGPLAINGGGSYVADPVNNATFGRGTITFGGLSFAYYPVDQTHAKVLEIDNSSFTSGDFFEQTGAIPSQNSAFTTSFAYLVGGTSFNSVNSFPLTRAGRFTPDGNGNLTSASIRFDQNNGGAPGCVDPTAGSGCSPSATGTYVIGTGTNFPVGRGTLSLVIPGQKATINDVFYMISPSSFVIQDTSANVIADGSMASQTGTFTQAALAGNYIFNLSGQVLPSGGSLAFEEDFVGQYALSTATTKNITGASDFVEPGSTSNRVPVFLNVAITGTLNVSGDGTQRNGYQLVLNGASPSPQINFIGYFTSPQQMFLIGTGTSRVTAGTVVFQPTP
ncbi:MAG TPA: hypothetical protein VE263_21550 [Candidatus Angelobacter sp.]|nr:hypothetical protein [Candidatus Angelobacter sp.]